MFIQVKIAVLLLAFSCVSAFEIKDAGTEGVEFSPETENGVQYIYEDGVENGGRVKLALIIGVEKDKQVVVLGDSFMAYLLEAKIEDGPNPGEVYLTGNRFSYDYITENYLPDWHLLSVRELGESKETNVYVGVKNPKNKV